MKKIIAWLLVLSLTAAISIGATLAYLTDTDEDVNVMTLGKVKIDQLEYERVDVESKDADATVQEFHDNKPLLPAVTDKDFDYTPGDTYVDWDQIGKDGYTSEIWDPSKINNEQDKMVFIKNKGDYDAYVRSVFAFEAGKYATLEEFQKMVHLNLNTTDYTWEWVETPVEIPNEEGGTTKYFVATATYNKVLAPGALTEISLSQIALDKTATNADVEAFGETYQILVKTQAIQADGFDNPVMALFEGFGEVDAMNVPWENDSPIKGDTVFNALHYLNADVTSENITAKVKNVTFGLTKEYASIASSYKGALVDVEQDVPVYAYYVNNGSTYDVYLLANDDIYLPKDSTDLMRDMTALTAVDTANLNTGRTENMLRLFRNCGKLTTLDTTGWDTSAVVNMEQLFYQCKSLETIVGLEDWDTGAVTNMMYMFREAKLSGDLDLSDWDVSSVTTMRQMFYKCGDLLELNAAGWDTSSVTDTAYMFYECLKLKSLNVTGWDVTKVTTTRCMFIRCRGMVEMIGSGGLCFSSVVEANNMCEGWDVMPYLDVTNWNFGSATSLAQMFAWALKLEKLEGLQNWDVSNVTAMNHMFYASVGLKEINVSGWDVSNVTAINGFLCSEHQNGGDMQLEKAIGFNTWNPEKVTNMGSMFYGCGQLKEIDLSGWNLPKLTSVSHMFADCFKLERIDLTGWKTPSLTNMDAMFNDCRVLKSVDLSSFDTSDVYYFSQLFEVCYALEEVIGLENFDTSKGDNFSEMFSGCGKLKELNLSSFDTRNADHLKEGDWVFLRFITGCTGLEKITFGPYFDFDGVGCAEGYKFVMPAATGVEGWDGKWYNAETGVGYLPSEIPECTAATYLAVNPNTAPPATETP